MPSFPTWQTNSDTRRRWLRPVLLVLCLLATAAVARGQSGENLDAMQSRAIRLYREGYVHRAIPEFEKTLAATERRWGAASVPVYQCKSNLGLVYIEASQFGKAEPVLRESLQGYIAAYKAGRGRVTGKEVGSAANNYAYYFHSVGQNAQALEMQKLALAYFEADGWNGPASSAHDNLGTICREMGDFQAALGWYDKALKFRLKQFGANDPRVAIVLSNIATVYYDQKRFADSERLSRRSLEINLQARGPAGDHMGLVNLAFSLEALGRFHEAEPLYREHLRLAETRFDEPSHLAAARACQWMARSSAMHGRWSEAVDSMERNRRQLLPVFASIAGGISEAEQRSLIGGYLSGLDDGLSIAWARRDDPTTVARAASWLANAKGLLYDCLAERTLLGRDARLLGQSALVEELEAVRTRLSAAMNQIGTAANDAERQQRVGQVRDLVAREAELSRQLGQAGGRDPAHWNWIELADVRRTLAPDAVFVDIIRARVQDYDAPVGPDGLPISQHYLAWLVPPPGAGDPAVFDLGAASVLEPMIAELTANIEKAGQTGSSRDELASLAKDYGTMAAELAKRILHPLVARAGQPRHWLLSPDADLWLVPWNTLPLADGQLFAERFRLTHVVSARDLLRRRLAGQAKASPPLIIADPNYDLGLTSPEQRARSVGRLPNTALEARLAAPLLEQICGAPPEIKLQNDARKSVALTAHSPRVLMLGTHGSFLASPAGERKGESGDPLGNPLLRCQLVFAGCNARPAPGQDNGILLGMEVLNCDLRATDLVILSACETGRGDVHGGQSAAGMRQAFQMAGAHDVLATLWSVDDEAATRLTSGFLRHLAAGRDKAEALRSAQTELRAELQREFGSAHPYYWAPYTLTGCEP